MPGALAFSTLRSPHSSPSAGRCLLCPCPCYRCLRCCAPAAARVARKGLNGAARGTSTTAVQCTCSTRGRASGHIFSFELESDTHFRPQSVRRAIRIRSTVWVPTAPRSIHAPGAARGPHRRAGTDRHARAEATGGAPSLLSLTRALALDTWTETHA